MESEKSGFVNEMSEIWRKIQVEIFDKKFSEKEILETIYWFMNNIFCYQDAKASFYSHGLSKNG